MKLEDLKIIVTGAARGMGAHFACRLQELGAQSWDSGPYPGQTLFESARAGERVLAGGRATVIPDIELRGNPG